MTTRHPFVEHQLKEPLRALLAERSRRIASGESGKPSAVLLPLFDRDGETHLWLVRRASGMRSHSGQVAFPGGKRDPHDESLVHTALRETHEEIGIAPDACDVLGPLDDLVTMTGYVITPVVAWVSATSVPTPNAGEVARVFSAPLRRFVQSSQDAIPSAMRLGYSVDGEFIWGATAAMAQSLGALVRQLLRDAIDDSH